MKIVVVGIEPTKASQQILSLSRYPIRQTTLLDKKSEIVMVGFEPTTYKTLVLNTNPLNHSGTSLFSDEKSGRDDTLHTLCIISLYQFFLFVFCFQCRKEFLIKPLTEDMLKNSIAGLIKSSLFGNITFK